MNVGSFQLAAGSTLHFNFSQSTFLFVTREIPTVSFIKGTLSVFGKLGIVAAILAAFATGLVGTVYLSLRSTEVTVPSVVGKNVNDGETELGKVGLNMRRRATRYNPDVPPNTILEQTPKPNEIVKSGQYVFVVLSKPTATEGESSVPVANQEGNTNSETNENQSPSENSNSTNENSNTNANNKNKNTNKNKNKNTNGNANNANGNKNGNNNTNTNTNANNRNANNSNNRNANNRNTNNSNNRNANNRNGNANNRNTNTRNSNSTPRNPPTNSNGNVRRNP